MKKEKLMLTLPDVIGQNVLDRQAIKYRKIKIPIEEIDFDLSLQNQARRHPITKEVREKYADFLRNDIDMPSPIIARVPETLNGRPVTAKPGCKYIIISGNHRTGGALDAGVTHIMAYLIDDTTGTHEEVYVHLPHMLNCGHGQDLPFEEKMLAAIHAVSSKQCKIEQAAKDYGFKEYQIYQYIKQFEVKQTLQENGVRVPNDAWVAPLARLPLESVQVVLGRVIVSADASALKKGDIEAMVSEVKKGKSEAAQFDIVRQQAEKLSLGSAPEKEPSQHRRPYRDAHRLIAWLTTGERLMKDKTKLSQFDLGAAQDKISKRIRAMEKCLHGLNF